MTELLMNDGASAFPYLIILVLCLFWLLGSQMQRREPSDEKKVDGPHASWRISEAAAPLRRIWQVTRKRTPR